MPFRVLVVDDSRFFQSRLKEIIDLHPELEVVGLAANGKEAIDMEEHLRPNVISMDYEMPYMDGISAIREIVAKRHIPIVMFSSMTFEGARVTLDALTAGAVDFIPKNYVDVARKTPQLSEQLHDIFLKVCRQVNPSAVGCEALQTEAAGHLRLKKSLPTETEARPPQRLAREEAHRCKKTPPSRTLSKPPPPSHGFDNLSDVTTPPVRRVVGFDPTKFRSLRLLLIGASTGGPVAVTELVSQLSSAFPVPIIVVQHMPGTFTKAFAERLNRQSALQVKEAAEGDSLYPGCVYIAQGGTQLLIDKSGKYLRIHPGDDRTRYRPAVDVTFASAASVIGRDTLAIVLTGMGDDGKEGARLLKRSGANVWCQDQASSVVFGMPSAVINAELADLVLPLNEIQSSLMSLGR